MRSSDRHVTDSRKTVIFTTDPELDLRSLMKKKRINIIHLHFSWKWIHTEVCVPGGQSIHLASGGEIFPNPTLTYRAKEAFPLGFIPDNGPPW